MSERAPAASLAALLLLAAHGTAADETDAALRKFEADFAAAPDPAARVFLIREAGWRGDPRVAAALKPILKNESLPVRAAVARCIGEQGDPAVAGILVHLFDQEADAKVPAGPFLAALLEGIGEADARGNYKMLMKSAKRWLDMDAEVAVGAARALARVRAAQTVEDLVWLMEAANSNGMYVSGAATSARAGSLPYIMAELRKATGQEFETVDLWRKWWKENGKNWKPAPEASAPASPTPGSGKYGDADGLFTIDASEESWTFRRFGAHGAAGERRVDGALTAEFRVVAADADQFPLGTPKSLAAAMRPLLEDEFPEIRRADSTFGAKVVLGRSVGFEHVVCGTHAVHGACTVRVAYLWRAGRTFILRGMFTGGKDDPPAKEIAALFESFRTAR